MSPLIKYSFYTILAGAVFLTGKELLFSQHNPAVINPANYSNIFDLSKGEFKMAENNLHTNQESNCYNTDAGEKIREYTDEYFEDKSFVVCAFYKSSWLGQYLIDKVEVKSNKLTLYIKYPRSDTADEVVNNVFLIAGVDKPLVADVTDIEYVLC